MSVKKCRICNRIFFEEPLLQYRNMPGAAQFLPDESSLAHDKGIDMEVYQCSGCGLVQLSNEPVPYYKEVIRAAAFSEEMKNFRRKQFKDFIKKFSVRKIVEIGCGHGEYLSLMKETGVDAYGIEYSEEAVKYCIKNGLMVSKGFIDDSNYRLDYAPFDAFFILNFLEHLPEPNSTLRGIYNNLSDGATGLVEVPNFDMILRKKLFSEFICDHLFYFTMETLNTTLCLNGFEVIQCNEEWYDYIISATVRKRSKTFLSDFDKHQKKLKEHIEEYIRPFDKVAVWGAGHQALAVISLTELAGKIKYVIDSAPFKQGKYTPATHIPIVPPELLNSDPVDAIIVMAASYSDEVAKIIRQKFHRDINIAILRDSGLEII
ncbi:MAG: methyltransferase domain-containing protein [Candidatus Eremiobacterota bacterium]